MQIIIYEISLSQQTSHPLAWKFPPHCANVKRLDYSISLLDFSSRFLRNAPSKRVLRCTRLCLAGTHFGVALDLFFPSHPHVFTQAWCKQLTQAPRKPCLRPSYFTTDEVNLGSRNISHYNHLSVALLSVKSVGFCLGSSMSFRSTT